MDLLDVEAGGHAWSVHQALERIAAEGRGVIVLLNCGESTAELLDRVEKAPAPKFQGRQELLKHGIGSQILRDLNVGCMRLLAKPRKMPSMTGWELEISGYEQPATSKA